MGVQDYLISARFLTTVGHLTALLLIFSSIQNNVEKSLADTATSSDVQIAYQKSIAALCFGIFCFIFDFSGIFFGTTLFNSSINMVQIAFHFTGSIFLSWMITEIWSHEALWPIVISTSIPTALIEFSMLLAIYVFKIVVY
jgi:hypothetical protein